MQKELNKMEKTKIELSKYQILYLINLCQDDQKIADEKGFPVSQEARLAYDLLVENS
jgi:hypothetical protein